MKSIALPAFTFVCGFAVCWFVKPSPPVTTLSDYPEYVDIAEPLPTGKAETIRLRIHAVHEQGETMELRRPLSSRKPWGITFYSPNRRYVSIGEPVATNPIWRP